MKVLVGPTGSGKTEVACRIAPVLGAEIVAADAMTIWRGLDVGTAKPTAAQRAHVRHHLLDIADPGGRPTLADVAQLAAQAVGEIRLRGRLPLVVGGSGLYLRAIVDGLTLPPANPTVRSQIEALSPDEAVRRLRTLDPDAFEYLDPANHRRVVRALEIAELTGARPSSLRKDWDRRADVPVVGLSVDPERLAERIRSRTAAMLAAGWVEECARFDAAGRRAEVLATQALGYGEVFAMLDGVLTSEQAADRIAQATIRLAKRQLTWFRADPRVRWVPADDLDRATDLVLSAYA